MGGKLFLDSRDPELSPRRRGDLITDNIPDDVIEATRDHRDQIRGDFKFQGDGCLFNGPIFGVISHDPWQVYETDYYTRRPIERVVGKHEPRPWWQRTGLGVHVLAELPDGSVVLTKRSGHITQPQRWQVSATEYVSPADLISVVEDKIDLHAAVSRAVSEKLNAKATNIKLVSHIVDKESGQDIILAVASINDYTSTSDEIDEVVQIGDIDHWLRHRHPSIMVYQAFRVYESFRGLPESTTKWSGWTPSQQVGIYLK